MRRRQYFGLLTGIFLTIGLAAISAFGQETSSLWGESGELWSPAGRLGDFSFAGYRTGIVEIPTVTNRINVKNFGAVGNGSIDDTAAFKAAIAQAVAGQAVYIPAGTYLIRDVLEIRKGGVVLQGESQNTTILKFDRSLNAARGPVSSGLYLPIDPPTDGLVWSFNGGFIWVQGDDSVNASTKLSNVTAAAVRGDKQLTVTSVEQIHVGDWVRLALTDPAVGAPQSGSLLSHLHADLFTGAAEQVGRRLVQFNSRVSAIQGNTITLERPLPVDVRLVWTPEVHRFAPTVQDVGIENLTLRFPDEVYRGHFSEVGYNGIFFYMVANSWVRNVKIINAESGLFIMWSNFNTLENITLDNEVPNNTTYTGHHGIDIYLPGSDNLVTGWNVVKPFVHDLSIEDYAMGNVFSNCRGGYLGLDHHRATPYQNLFTNMQFGAGGGSRTFESGGAVQRGPYAAAYNTYWNMQGNAPLGIPPFDYGPRLNFIGIQTTTTSVPTSYQWLFENINPTTMRPQNIYEAQLARRKAGSNTPPSAPNNLTAR